MENSSIKERPFYIEKIKPFIDKTDFIKVLTGVRRSGKSSLLLLVQRELLSRGISEDNIISMNMENLVFADIETSKDLNNYVVEHKATEGRTYLFIDEIREIKDWEKGINSLRASSDIDIDIYITGSNSKLLSGELSTYLTGRYVSFEIMPLGFREYLNFLGYSNPNLTIEKQELLAELETYLAQGGFPGIVEAAFSRIEGYTALNDLYQSAMLRDVVQRNKVRNIDLLDRLSRYIFDNVGRIFSANNIVNYLKNERRTVDAETIYNYLRYLEEAFLITRVQRFDIEGKAYFKTNEKFFPIDHALRHAVLGYDQNALGAVCENVVFNEIKRRGYNSIQIGKLGTREVDFVAQGIEDNANQTIYIQVTLGIFDEPTVLEREFSPLESINDSFPKYVVSLRDGGSISSKNKKGIGYVNLLDFLLADNW